MKLLNFFFFLAISFALTAQNAAVLNPYALPPVICEGESTQLNAGFVSGPGTLQTLTYSISPSDLIGVSGFCSGSGVRLWNGGTPGFRWQDTGSGAVQSVVVEFTVGVEETNTPHTRDVTLNGSIDPNGSFPGTAYNNNCFAAPSPSNHVTLNLTPSLYRVGSQNTIFISGTFFKWGLSPGVGSDFSGDQYAKITVTYLVFDGTYSWSPGGSTSEYLTVTPTETTTYTVTADYQGNTTTAQVTVGVTPRPVISADGPITDLCPGQAVTLTSSPAGSYLWSNGATTPSITVNSGGTYAVTADNCLTATPVTVTYQPAPAITADGPTQFCDGGTVGLTATEGSAYLWSTGETTQSIIASQTGNYSVTVTSASGCGQTASQDVTVAPLPEPEVRFDLYNACDTYSGWNLRLDNFFSDYVGRPITLAWYRTGETEPVSTNYYINVPANGNYYLVVSSEGCPDVVSETIQVQVDLGNPSEFGDHTWNVYVFQNENYYEYDPYYVYYGYYTEPSLSFDTRDRWDANYESPYYASGFTGCYLYEDYFLFSAKRRGFPCGYYQISIPGHDDWAELWVNGVKVWEHQDCCDDHANVWEGNLGPNSTIELKVTEISGSAFGAIDLNLIHTDITAPPVITASGPLDICSDESVMLTSDRTTGNLWNTGETTQSITVNSAGNYFVTTEGGEGCTAQSEPVTVSVTPVSTHTETVTVCESYTWPVDGLTYSESGIYTFTSGCQTEVLELTVQPVGTHTETVEACQSFTWPVNGTTYTESGTYTHENGCVTEALILTVWKKKPEKPGPVSGPDGNLCDVLVTFTCEPAERATSYTWTAPAGTTIVSGNGTTSIQLSISAGFPGGQLSVVSNNACGSSGARKISLQPKPSQPEIDGPACVSAYQVDLVFTVTNPEPGVAYTWKAPNNATITSGQGTASITVNWGNKSGKLTCTPSNSCASGPKGNVQVIVGCSSANGESGIAAKSGIAGQQATIFPNPTAGFAQILFTVSKESEYTLLMTDLTGKRLHHTTVWAVPGENKIDIDLSRFADGIYIVNLIGAENVESIRVVKTE